MKTCWSGLVLAGCLPQLPVGGGVGSDSGPALECERFWDGDGDGYGGASAGLAPCGALPEGQVESAGDCDDADPEVFPGATESCDGVDQDCDGAVDEDAADTLTLYTDADGDGFGAGAPAAQGCEVTAGHALSADDCDDSRAEVNPAAEEVCDDGLDNDCAPSPGCAWGGEQSTDIAASRLTGVDEAANGWALAMGPDLDGDGPAELLVGSPLRDEGGNDTGTAWLVFGQHSWESTLSLARQPRADGARRDQLGFAVALPGDLNGDGHPELVVGAPYSDALLADGGAVHVFYGAGQSLPRDSLLGEELDGIVLYGSRAGDGLGASAVGPGDLDGDGRVELLLGAPQAEDGGAVWLIYGASAALPSAGTVDAVASARVSVGEGREGSLGGRGGLGGADLDGDGRAELLLGAPGYASGAERDGEGAVFVLSTAEDRFSGALLAEDAALRVEGGAAGAQLGQVLVSGEDLDGDGYPELLMGAPGGDGQVLGMSGAATLPSGALGPEALGWTLAGEAGSAAGSALALTDLDGDGQPDLAVGAPGLDGGLGGVVVLYGPLGAGTLALGDADLVVRGTRAAGALGAALAGGQDLDADGVEDLALGAPGEAGGIGGIWLLLGQGE